MLSELEKCRQAGINSDKALAEAMTAGWQGFKTEWLVNRLKQDAWSAPATGSRSAVLQVPAHHQEMYPDDLI